MCRALATVCLLLLAAGCGRSPPAGAPNPAPAHGAPAAEAAAPVLQHLPVRQPMPPLGPTDDEAFALLVQLYDRIRAAGGLPVTVTATGRSHLLMPRAHKLVSVRCEPNRHTQQVMDCGVTALVTLREGERDPGRHTENVRARWDPVAGRWFGE